MTAPAPNDLGRPAPRLKDSAELVEFAALVGDSGPISIVGSATTGPHGAGRIVGAPVGLVELRVDEMTVRCRAGTMVADLQETLAEAGQRVALPASGGTVGGALARGRSDVTRLGRGPVRDALLEAIWVDHRGRLVASGGPTVKNVSGFDLVRLLVGSWGTLGPIAEVVLRTNPIPRASRWFSRPCDSPAELSRIQRETYRPASLLWDGHTLWLLAEGHEDDVARLEGSWSPEEESPPLPGPHRVSMAPTASVEWMLARGSGATSRIAGADAERAVGAVLEVGVGIVHSTHPIERPEMDTRLVALHQRVKNLFDPDGRFNPGVDVLTIGV